MICHAITVVMSAVGSVNAGQTPVLALEKPLYILAKLKQWNWPEKFGKQQLVLMLGGLHTEMAALKTLGDLLDGNGSTAA